MAFGQAIEIARTARNTTSQCASVFLRDIAHGLLEVTHNTFALLGLILATAALFVASRADLRHEAEVQALNWLQSRQETHEEPTQTPAPTQTQLLAAELSEPDAIARATASDLKDLSRPQAAAAVWLARRYRVAPEPVGRLVKEAWQVGAKAGLDPTLILAIMAIESSFNPFAQSAVGAQGLMQVMTKVHNDKYEAFGGNHAAFDPVTNLRVGVQVLKECIARAGSLEAGLRYYVGASNLADDGGYASKVLNEQNSLRKVVGEKATPVARLQLRNVATTGTAPPAPIHSEAAPNLTAPHADDAPEQNARLL